MCTQIFLSLCTGILEIAHNLVIFSDPLSLNALSQITAKHEVRVRSIRNFQNSRAKGYYIKYINVRAVVILKSVGFVNICRSSLTDVRRTTRNAAVIPTTTLDRILFIICSNLYPPPPPLVKMARCEVYGLPPLRPKPNLNLNSPILEKGGICIT
jgi:hypothetical protein